MSILLQTKDVEGQFRVSWNWKISPKFREIETKLVKITTRVRGLGYSFSLKMKWGYISAEKLDTERALLLPVYISLKTKFIMS